MATSSPPSEFPPGYLEEYCGGQLVVANTIMLVTATIFLGLRLYARSFKNVSRGWDDFLLLPSWVFLAGLCIVDYVSVTMGGTGYHVQAVLKDDPQKLVRFSQFLYAAEWFWTPSITLSKVSVVILYLRIFTRKLDRVLCFLTIAFLISYCVAIIIAAQLQCIPLSHLWNPFTTKGHCFNRPLWYELMNFPNIVGDLAILLLPLRTIWTLNASTGRKAVIWAVCLTGSIGLITACVRTVKFFSEAERILTDPTWVGSPLLVWTVVECGMYFNSACLVGLRPLYSRAAKWLNLHMTVKGSGFKSLGTNNGNGNTISLIESKRPWKLARLESMKSDSQAPIALDLGAGSLKASEDNGESDGNAEVERNPCVWNPEIRVETEIYVNSIPVGDDEEALHKYRFAV